MVTILSPWIRDVESIKKPDIYNKIKTIIKEKKKSDYGLANIRSRIELLNKVKDILKNIPSHKCITSSDSDLASIENKFFLHGRIGTKSKYGHAYIVMSKDKLIQSSIKIVDDDKFAIREVKVIKKIIRHQKNNMHLPIIYKIMYCDISLNNNIWIHDKAPKSLSSLSSSSISLPSNYYIIMNELAHGDLKSFINTKKYVNEKLYINSLTQVFISIASLHQLGFNHNDSHYGNFLFHKIPPGGCFSYKIDGKNLYLENLGFIWTIWDFGLCEPLNKDYIEDFRRIINAFLPRTYRRLILNSSKIFSYHRGWNSLVHEPSKLQSIINIDNVVSTNKVQTSKDIFDFLISIIFSETPIGKIINEKPIKIKTIKTVFP